MISKSAQERHKSTKEHPKSTQKVPEEAPKVAFLASPSRAAHYFCKKCFSFECGAFLGEGSAILERIPL